MSTATALDVQMIPALKIVQIPGMNPRGEFSHDDPEFLQLKASIAERGIESPIKVGPAEIESGKELLYPVIWGHRRHAVTLELGIDCPAIVDPTLDTPEKRYLAAVSENQDRQDMSPVAEAGALVKLRDLGLKQEDAAKKMNVSVRTARDREKLLALPDATRAAFDRGDIDLQAIPAIAAVAERAPKLADYLASVVEGDPDDPSTRSNYARASELTAAIRDAKEDAAADIGCVVRAHQIAFGHLKDAGIAKARLAGFQKLYTKIEKTHPYYWRSVTLSDEDLAAAKAAGCLLEVESSQFHAAWITDPAWLIDFFDERLQQELKEAEEARASSRTSRSHDAAEAKERDDSPEAKEKRRQERENDYLDKLRRRRANIAVGERSLGEYAKPALLLEEAQLLALMALGGDAKQIADKGLIFCEEGLQEVTEQKNGKTKVAYGRGKDAGEETTKAILESKDPLAAIGVALRALALTVAADDEVVAPSSRGYWTPTYGISNSVGKLLKAIVAKRGLDSSEIRRQLERQDQAAALEDEISLLDGVAKCRAKAGLSVNGAYLTDLLVAAVGKRQLKQHEDDDEGEVTFTITAAGKKRLEKARTELKALGVKGQRPAPASPAKAVAKASNQKTAAKLSDQANGVLDRIKAEPGIAASKLANDARIKPNALYRIIGDLEKAGLLSKDGRKYTVVAAKEGSDG